MASILCRIARERLSDRVDDQPAGVFERAYTALHLAICPPCRRVVRSFEATRSALSGLRDVDPDPIDPP